MTEPSHRLRRPAARSSHGRRARRSWPLQAGGAQRSTRHHRRDRWHRPPARLPPGGGGRLRPTDRPGSAAATSRAKTVRPCARRGQPSRPAPGVARRGSPGEHATELLEPPELGRRLDPFGHGRQAERTPDFDDRTDDTGSLTRIVQRSHERPVDLDMGNGETLQVGQRRVSGPKVVDGNMNAQAADGVQLFEGGGAVVHQQALGELESNPARGRASVSHGRLKSPGEPWVGELMGRDVDRHAGHPAGGKLSPSGGFGARGPKDPRTDLIDPPRLLGEGDEDARAILPWVGWSQRMSASAPTRSPVRRSTIGW